MPLYLSPQLDHRCQNLTNLIEGYEIKRFSDGRRHSVLDFGLLFFQLSQE